MIKIINESMEDFMNVEPEIVKDRGGKMYKETQEKLDKLNRGIFSDRYIVELNKEKLADKTLVEITNEAYEACMKLSDYLLEMRRRQMFGK